MNAIRTIPTMIVGVLSLLALVVIDGCGRDQSPVASRSSASAAAPVSSNQASVTDAQSSVAVSPAPPSAGTAANAAGLNRIPPESVNVAEQAQAAGDEAPQELRNKVNAAKDAGRAPVR